MDRPRVLRPIASRPARAASLIFCAAATAAFAGEDAASLYPPERPRDPPAAVAARDVPWARSPGARLALGSYVSVQVNVDELGQNILNDAANEPSITVNPLNPSNLVIGWREFSSVTSDFRQAGWAYSLDGGQSWTFPGVLTPGVFRSDPVLGADSDGILYYQSLLSSFDMQVFSSSVSGVSWGLPVNAFGGDKNWMAIDRSGGIGDGHNYGTWQRFFGCCGQATLTRSTDGAQSFETPVEVVLRPLFGTMAVGPDGELYISGIDGTVTQDATRIVVAASTNARDAGQSPTFSGSLVPLGGSLVFGGPPNPAGLLGQINVAVDPSFGPNHGNVYVVASVDPPGSGTPVEVRFSRSADGGQTWSPAVRINDDPLGNGMYHWMAAHSVSPDGRIDVIWNDTRNSGSASISELFYSYSWDGGESWSPNVAVSPPFNSTVGWPQQNKIGDYYTIVSDESAGNVAYSATFNGEQDVYFVRVFPDCNGNGQSDVDDVAQGSSTDCDGNHVLDECETTEACLPASGSIPSRASKTDQPLLLRKGPGGEVLLDWDDSCVLADTDYGVYRAPLGVLANLIPLTCTTGGLTEAQDSPPSGDFLYLVVPNNLQAEGSYGKDSENAQRLPGANACFPQKVRNCGGPQPHP